MNSESWNEYVTHALHQAQETDRQPLGGSRPEYSAIQTGLVVADDDSSFKPNRNLVEAKGGFGEEEKNIHDSGDMYNDQVKKTISLTS
jgi:hypothetical protein